MNKNILSMKSVIGKPKKSDLLPVELSDLLILKPYFLVSCIPSEANSIRRFL